MSRSKNFRLAEKWDEEFANIIAFYKPSKSLEQQILEAVEKFIVFHSFFISVSICVHVCVYFGQ